MREKRSLLSCELTMMRFLVADVSLSRDHMNGILLAKQFLSVNKRLQAA